MSEGTSPLAGITVVGLEQAVSAPLATRHLADLGATVIKVERPETGDFARAYDAVVRGQSAYFVWLNHGKRSVALDLKAEADRARFDRLLAGADVLVQNLGPRAVTSLGLGWEELHRRYPHLIVCSISGYGQDGPYRDRKAYDLLLQGESGLISVTGNERDAAKVGISVADICAGMYALSSVLACLYERARSGEAHFIDVSMLECLAEWMSVPALYQIYAGAPPPRTGLRHNMIVPYGPYLTRDGLVNIAVHTDLQWGRFCSVVLGRPSLADDERFTTNERRVRARGELEPVIERILSALSRATVLERLDRADIPSGALNAVADLVDHPQLASRLRWTEVGSPAGPVRVLHHPMNIDGLIRRVGQVPALGADSHDIPEPDRSEGGAGP